MSARINDIVVKEMARLYRRGWTYTAIGKKFNVDRGTVARRVQQYFAKTRLKKTKPFPDIAAKWPSVLWFLDRKGLFVPLASRSPKEIEALFSLEAADKRIEVALVDHSSAPHLNAEDVAFVQSLRSFSTEPTEQEPASTSARCEICERLTGLIRGYGPKVCATCRTKFVKLLATSR